MLERVEHDNGVVTYASPRLRAAAVVHAFSTRIGGISEGPYASLNLGSLAKGDEGDSNVAVAENFRRLRAALGREQARRVIVRQVHGGAVWRAPAAPLRPEEAPEADAIVSTEPAHLLTVRVADCVPVLLASRGGAVVAAVHAGWRGLVAGVIGQAVGQLAQMVDVGELVAAVGPHIGAAHFEVGPEVVQAFEHAGLGEAVREHVGGKAHVDMLEAALMQLEAGGVRRDQVDFDAGLCTFERVGEFFSHRRDAGATGRMAAVISPGCGRFREAASGGRRL